MSKQLVGALAAALALASAPAFGHGEFDEAMLAEFHLHLDDLEEEVQELVGDVDSIVADADRTVADVDELTEHWEEVGVHAVIETRASLTYPGIWQGIVLLREAVTSGDAAAVSAAGEQLKAALWQGYGAVRLAASQVEAGTAPSTASAAEPLSGSETIATIIAGLERAVAAYRAGELADAEALIHDSYMNHFEGIEGDLIAQDADLVAGLEVDFNAGLPLLMQQGAPLDAVTEKLESMTSRLNDARVILESVEASRSEVF